MPIPGVIVSENSSGAIEIEREPTAVPLFLGKFVDNDTLLGKGDVLRIENYADFSANFKSGLPTSSLDATVTFKAAAIDKVDITSSGADAAIAKSYLSIYHYFVNGGGPCYIMLSDRLTAATLPTALKKITGYPSISILVNTIIGNNSGNLSAAATLSALANFAVQYKGYFVLADKDSMANLPDESKASTALYYPPIIVDWSFPEITPNTITIAGTGGPKASANGGESDEGTGVETKALKLSEVDSSDAEKIKDIKDAIKAELDSFVKLSPAPAIAGLIAKTDRAYGPWRAPANIPVACVKSLVWSTGDNMEDIANQNVNLIRSYGSNPAVIMGARTAATDTGNRYISVRRLLNMIERDAKDSLNTLTFRLNNEHTWELARAAVENYLRSLWQQKALVGSKEADAFRIFIGMGSTMDQADIDAGKMIMQILVAPVRPAEFDEIELTQLIS